MRFQFAIWHWKQLAYHISILISNRLIKKENSAVATGLEKVSFHSSTKECNAKECSNYCTITIISYVSKVMLKILQARLQQYVYW